MSKWIIIVYTTVGLLMPLRVEAQTLNQESSWIQGKEYRLKIETFQSDTITKHPVLVVVLHGDSPFHKPDYQNTFAQKIAKSTQNVVAVGLLRPGYTDPQGDTSEGKRGKTNGDNWNARNTDAIADAVHTLKNRHKSRKVAVTGHSGGAAITANILGRQPKLIDAALLVSCPCDVKKWRENMRKLTGNEVFNGEIKTLSPIEQIANISDQVNILMIVGREDKVAPPYLSESYHKKVAAYGKDIRLVQLEGKGHEIFLDSKVLDKFGEIIKGL